MAKVNELLAQLQDISDNPKKMLNKYLDNGKKVIGCFPIYTPDEIVHASGMIPMGIWGGQINPSVAGQYVPIFICSIMRSCLEFGMKDKYKGLSAVIVPILCDTLRGMSGAWRVGVKDIPMLGFIQPQNRDVEGSVEFLASEYDELKRRLEEISGSSITEEQLLKSIDLYNEHSAIMREFTEVANDHLDIITPKVRHAVMRSAQFMERSEHLSLMKDLVKELKAIPKHIWQGKKVILTGITGEPNDLLDIFENYNIAVVGDDLAQESRQFRTAIPQGANALESLSLQWNDRKGCATVHEKISSRGELVKELVKETSADGVIICLMSFCDVEEYEYPMLMKDMNKADIPVLAIDIDQGTEDSGQSLTKIQTFAEML